MTILHPSMLSALPSYKPKLRDMVEITNGPQAGMIGRVQSITGSKGRERARVVFTDTERSVLVSVSYLIPAQ